MQGIVLGGLDGSAQTRPVAGWTTISALTTGGGTLVLAWATFVSRYWNIDGVDPR